MYVIKLVVAVDKYSLFRGGRKLSFDCTLNFVNNFWLNCHFTCEISNDSLFDFCQT